MHYWEEQNIVTISKVFVGCLVARSKTDIRTYELVDWTWRNGMGGLLGSGFVGLQIINDTCRPKFHE